MSAFAELARFLASDRARDLDENVRYEAQRLLIDWLGCVLAGIDAPALDSDARRERSREAAQATVAGTGERLDLPAVAALHALAAVASGYAAEHPREPLPLAAIVASALLPLAEARAACGAAALDACACGIEVGVRLADIPSGGVTGLGAARIAAAAACAHLLGLDPERTQRALEAAALPASPLGGAESQRLAAVAAAARSGLTAALQAQVDGSSANGNASSACAPPGAAAEVVGGWPFEDLGCTWRLQAISYKTYPCARALHPAIEACQALHLRYRAAAGEIEAVELLVHPDALAACRTRDPQDDGQAGYSLHHMAAAALLHGASARQFDARELRSERLARLRARVQAVADEAVGRDGVHVRLRLRSGEVREQRLRCARGAPGRPLGDAELAAKFRHLAANVLATSQAERLLALAWNMPALADAGALVRAAVPEEEVEALDLPGSPLIPR